MNQEVARRTVAATSATVDEFVMRISFATGGAGSLPQVAMTTVAPSVSVPAKKK